MEGAPQNNEREMRNLHKLVTEGKKVSMKASQYNKPEATPAKHSILEKINKMAKVATVAVVGLSSGAALETTIDHLHTDGDHTFDQTFKMDPKYERLPVSTNIDDRRTESTARKILEDMKVTTQDSIQGFKHPLTPLDNSEAFTPGPFDQDILNAAQRANDGEIAKKLKENNFEAAIKSIEDLAKEELNKKE